MKKHLLQNSTDNMPMHINMKWKPEKSRKYNEKTKKGKSEKSKNQKFQNFQNPKNQNFQNFRTRGLTPRYENQKNENFNHAIFKGCRIHVPHAPSSRITMMNIKDTIG